MKGKQGAIHRYLFGEDEPVGIIKPYGVTVHREAKYTSAIQDWPDW